MNIEEINKWLDREYGVSYTGLEELHDWLCDETMKKDKEIERLQRKNEIIQTRLRTRAREDRKRKAKLRKLRLETTNQRLKLERLHSIIKEVREYIEKELSFNVVINGKENKIIGYNKAFDKILEILDKENINEENK